MPVTTQLPPRTDSDVVLRELKLRFGDNDYTVPVLRMRQAAKWREEYFKRTKSVSDDMPQKFAEEAKPGELKKAINTALFGALMEFPDKIPELVFSYANQPDKDPTLPVEKVTDEAYDQDFARAFQQIWQVAFEPFFGSLGMVMEMQRAQQRATPSTSSATLN